MSTITMSSKNHLYIGLSFIQTFKNDNISGCKAFGYLYSQGYYEFWLIQVPNLKNNLEKVFYIIIDPIKRY